MASGKPVRTIILRGLTVLSYMIAAIVMFVSHQKVDDDSYKFVAKFNDWNGFMFFAVLNCIGCVYNLLVVLIPPGSQLWKTVVVLDVIVSVIVGTSLGSGWQTYMLITSGNIVGARWRPICGVVPFFCSKILGSLITSTFGFVLSIGLLMCTLHVSVDPFLVGPRS